MLVDITDLVVPPQIGWSLVGNKLMPPADYVVTLKMIIKSRIKYYQDQAPELLRDLYAGANPRPQSIWRWG